MFCGSPQSLACLGSIALPVFEALVELARIYKWLSDGGWVFSRNLFMNGICDITRLKAEYK
jgi:hypothetical protein